MGFSKSITKRDVHSNTSLPQETRETSNKQSNLIHLKQLEKEPKTAKVSRRREIIKKKSRHK